jgi:hypothetical protein
MTPSELQAVVTPPQPLPGVPAGPLSGLSWLPPAGPFIFSSPAGFHLVTTTGALRWTIPTRYQPHGWLLQDSDLYVQDGCVISQYDLRAVVRQVAMPVPENACNLHTGRSWSAQQPGAGIESIFTDSDRTDVAYSAPVSGWSGTTPMVYVLSAAGRIHGLQANLSNPVPPFMSSEPPDPSSGLVASGARRLCRLRYVSADGQVVTLRTQPLGIESTVPSAVPAATWSAVKRAAATPEQWSYQLSLDASPVSVTVSWNAGDAADSGSHDRVTLTWVDPGTSWNVLHLDCGAAPSTPGRLAQARVTGDGSGGPPPRLLTPPCTLVEDDAIFLYAVTAPPSASADCVSLQKFKLQTSPDAQPDPWAWVATTEAGAASRLVVPWAQATTAGTAAAAVPFDQATTFRCMFSALRAYGPPGDALDEMGSAGWRSLAPAAARVMTANGVPAPETAAALAEATLSWPGPRWLVTAAAAVQGALGDQSPSDPVATTEALRAAGRSARQTLAALQVLHGLAVVTPAPPHWVVTPADKRDAWSGAFGPGIAGLEAAVWAPPPSGSDDQTGDPNQTLDPVGPLTAAPQAAYREPFTRILSAVQQVYGLSPADFAALLRAAGFLGIDAADVLQLERTDAAAVLTSAGFEPTEIARAVAADRYGGWPGAVAAMIAAGCSPEDAGQSVLALLDPRRLGARMVTVGGRAGFVSVPTPVVVPGETVQQLMTELKTACDAAHPGQLTPARLAAAAMAPCTRTVAVLAALKDQYTDPMGTLILAVKARTAPESKYQDSAEGAGAVVFGVVPTLRWMYATQGPDADWGSAICAASCAPFSFPGSDWIGSAEELAKPMAEAGIPPDVTFRYLHARTPEPVNNPGKDEMWPQAVLHALQTVYGMTPDQAAALATSG